MCVCVNFHTLFITCGDFLKYNNSFLKDFHNLYCFIYETTFLGKEHLDKCLQFPQFHLLLFIHLNSRISHYNTLKIKQKYKNNVF